MNDSSKNSVRGRKGYYQRQIELEAKRQGLTVEEYGVYKGHVGSAVKPINSAGGLLFLSILISLICTLVFVLGVIVVTTPGTANWVQVVISFVVALSLPPPPGPITRRSGKPAGFAVPTGRRWNHPPVVHPIEIGE